MKISNLCILKGKAFTALSLLFSVVAVHYCWYQIVIKWFAYFLFSDLTHCMVGEDLQEVSESEISAAAERPQWLIDYSQAVADDVADCVRGLPGGVSEGTLRELMEAAVQDNYHAHSLRDPVLIQAEEDYAFRNILTEAAKMQSDQIERLHAVIDNQRGEIERLNDRVADQHSIITQLVESIRHK